jgi:hypothetical protein
MPYLDIWYKSAKIFIFKQQQPSWMECGAVGHNFERGPPKDNPSQMQGLTNPLARCPGLVISTFGLAEIISCMPDGLVKIYIGYWQTCQYSRIFLYSYMLYVV